MAVRNARKQDLGEELERVKRRMEQAVFELSEARDRMPPKAAAAHFAHDNPRAESDLTNLCISLELALQDTRNWARQLADKAREVCYPVPSEVSGRHSGN
ncbi:MAG: hypothetical protein JWP03_2130 [Phycisphaerales bacterium]|jgi:hypothetical protein|nr:hypothetical protein [Phycisphaerales bacterium]